MSEDTLGKVKGFWHEHKKISIGIIIIAVILIAYWLDSGSSGITPLSQKTTWYERNKDTIERLDNLREQAENLVSIGKYNEAIPLLKEAAEGASVYTFFDREFFKNYYGDDSKDEQLDKLSEYEAFGRRAALYYYNLAFAYRDSKEIVNKIPLAIDAAKNSVKYVDGVMTVESIQKDLGDNGFSFGRTEETKATYLSMLADLYRLHGAVDLSIQTHREAIGYDPNNDELYVWLGVAYAANGQYSLARQQWRKALEINPTNANASKNLQLFNL